MPRGRPSQPGDTRTAPNGYHYTRTTKEWRLTHHMVAEKKLGRLLKTTERVYFKDKDKTNMSWDNLVVLDQGAGSKNRRVAQLEDRIRELTAELEELNNK